MESGPVLLRNPIALQFSGGGGGGGGGGAGGPDSFGSEHALSSSAG